MLFFNNKQKAAGKMAIAKSLSAARYLVLNYCMQ